MTYEELADELLRLSVNSAYLKTVREFADTTKPEIFVLTYLKSRGGHAYPKDLSKAFLVSTARVAVILNKLEKEGYIRRAADSGDNRHTVVEMTGKGDEVITRRKKELIVRLSDMLKLLGEDDAKEYIRLQKKIAKAAEELL